MSTTEPRTQTPMPAALANLKPPTQADAIALMERRARALNPQGGTAFEDTSVGRRCGNGEYEPQFCADARKTLDATPGDRDRGDGQQTGC